MNNTSDLSSKLREARQKRIFLRMLLLKNLISPGRLFLVGKQEKVLPISLLYLFLVIYMMYP